MLGFLSVILTFEGEEQLNISLRTSGYFLQIWASIEQFLHIQFKHPGHHIVPFFKQYIFKLSEHFGFALYILFNMSKYVPKFTILTSSMISYLKLKGQMIYIFLISVWSSDKVIILF